MVQGNQVLLESRYECQFQKQVKYDIFVFDSD